MHRKENLKKIKRCAQANQCMICRIARIPFLITISSVILLQKYYHPLEKSTLAALTQPLIKPAPSRLRSNFREAQLLSDRRQTLLGYNNFAAIITKIKPVVIECIRRDRPRPMHYQQHSHQIMLKHSILKRRALPISHPNPPSAKEFTNQSTDQDQNSEPRRKEPPNCPTNETASMRRLTRNLSSMVRRFEDQNDFHSSFIFELMNYASKHALEPPPCEEQVWRRELEDNSISLIMRISKRDAEGERLLTNPEPPSKNLFIQDNYGFNPRFKNVNDEYKPERKKIASPQFVKPMKENIPNRIQTDYDCEVIKKGKKKSISSKKDLQKGRKFLGSLSKKKDCKLGSVTKSRVK